MKSIDAEEGWCHCPKAHRCVGPPCAADFRLRASVEVTDARNAESRFALGVSDFRAQDQANPGGESTTASENSPPKASAFYQSFAHSRLLYFPHQGMDCGVWNP